MVTLIASRRAPMVERLADPPSRRNVSIPMVGGSRPDFDIHFVDPSSASRPTGRFVPPAPETTPEKTERLLAQQNGNGRQRKTAARMRQGQLPLEIVSKGRFEKSEPTIHHGQDLDVPTYIRRGIALN